ncbi:MAG: hypothetical protein Q9191_008219, partial [Dirinaria sp. TL-2023a]
AGDGVGGWDQGLRVDGGVGQGERVGERLHRAGDQWVGAQGEECEHALREDEEGQPHEQREEGGQADGAEGGGYAVVEGGDKYLTRSRSGCGEPVEVPLRDCGGGSGALDPCTDGERPEIDQDEEEAKEPSRGVDDEEILCAGQMAPQEDAGEHGHP